MENRDLPIRKRKLQVEKEVQADSTSLPSSGGGGGGGGGIEEAVAVYSSARPPLPPGLIKRTTLLPPQPLLNLPHSFPRLPDPPLYPSVPYPPPSSFRRKPRFIVFFPATADQDDGDDEDYEKVEEDGSVEDDDEEGGADSAPTTSTSAAESAQDSILDPEPESRDSDLESRHCVSVSESGSIEDDSFSDKKAESPRSNSISESNICGLPSTWKLCR